jgi:hypothetical protein
MKPDTFKRRPFLDILWLIPRPLLSKHSALTLRRWIDVSFVRINDMVKEAEERVIKVVATVLLSIGLIFD